MGLSERHGEEQEGGWQALEWAIRPAAHSRRFHSLPAPSFQHIGPRGGIDSNSSTRNDLLCGPVKARFAFTLDATSRRAESPTRAVRTGHLLLPSEGLMDV